VKERAGTHEEFMRRCIQLDLIVISAIRHILDFSGKLCHCYNTLNLLGSTFKNKGKHMDRL
jgi:hypothetical protein